MKVLILLGLVSCALARSADEYIVNGATASDGEYPWQVSFRTTSHICGAVVIHQNWALTAGHCVGDPVNSYSCEFGTINRGSGTVVNIINYVRHPQYDSGTGFTDNDVAVIEVNVPAFSSRINVVPGGIDTGISRVGQECWISGWGKTCGDAVGCSPPVGLLEAEIQVVANSVCENAYNGIRVQFVASMMVCLLDSGEVQQQTSCQGDSGGPLVCRSGAADSYDLIGVTSWGASGCPVTSPVVYTRLSNYRSFICTTTRNQVCF
jgi:secreted trypsin-like serine protease